MASYLSSKHTGGTPTLDASAEPKASHYLTRDSSKSS